MARGKPDHRPPRQHPASTSSPIRWTAIHRPAHLSPVVGCALRSAVPGAVQGPPRGHRNLALSSRESGPPLRHPPTLSPRSGSFSATGLLE
eukprot:1086216-Pyramimonas_sp.AAC.1